MIEHREHIAIIIVIGFLVVSDVFFAFNYFSVKQDLQTVEASAAKTELNTKVINFSSLFIRKVLQANTEVDFETRLSLENAVRDLKDPEIMTEWQNFTGSKTEADAQASVKKLLGILISKIQT
ncbi:MAG: hypothetical protein PHT16_03850 [Candidatus Pacebacteria bacterium]|nr:hypothetical protein [Candidatus Paceibacterota bacterium]